MNRYEVTFVIQTDMEDIGNKPWWLLCGEESWKVEDLEYILVRDMAPDENVLDGQIDPDAINIIDMVSKLKPKPELKLVVDNGANNDKQT